MMHIQKMPRKLLIRVSKVLFRWLMLDRENNSKRASHFLINENRKSSDHVINCDVRRAFVFDESSWKINYVSKYDHHCTKKTKNYWNLLAGQFLGPIVNGPKNPPNLQNE